MSLITEHDPSNSSHFFATNTPQITFIYISGDKIEIIDVWGPYVVRKNRSNLCYVQVASLPNGSVHILHNPFLIGAYYSGEVRFIQNIPNPPMSSVRRTLSNAIEWISRTRKPHYRHSSYRQWMNTEWEIHQHLDDIVQQLC